MPCGSRSEGKDEAEFPDAAEVEAEVEAREEELAVTDSGEDEDGELPRSVSCSFVYGH